jgi:hypothetical protein
MKREFCAVSAIVGQIIDLLAESAARAPAAETQKGSVPAKSAAPDSGRSHDRKNPARRAR